LKPSPSEGLTSGTAVLLDGVTKRYDTQLAVEGLSITVRKGEFLTILGASGSGKSTTLAMVAGFVSPDTGRILINGHDMTHTPPGRRGLGMVFQNYALFPHLDVFENVAFPLRVRHVANRDVANRVSEALSTVRLAGMERRHARQLSGGQQQRVALARAIVARPEIVLMDEPLGALDKGLRYQMQTEIADIQRRLGMTVIFVTHDQEEAMNLSDRIAIMERGRVMQIGPPREVYERPDTIFVARFLGESNLIEGVAVGHCLRTAIGRDLRAANAAEGKSFLFVRPEKLSLTAGAIAETGDTNQMEGTVSRLSFLGNLIRAELAAGNGQTLMIDMTNGPNLHLPGVGERATARWAANDSRLLTH
jgi:spermidine/putrescine ABC transporter ATP-binding subunit